MITAWMLTTTFLLLAVAALFWYVNRIDPGRIDRLHQEHLDRLNEKRAREGW